MSQDELPTRSLDDIEDTDKTPSQEKRRKLSLWKCEQCRNVRQKCFPADRCWPQICDRCHEKGIEYSQPELRRGPNIRIRGPSSSIPATPPRSLGLGALFDPKGNSTLEARIGGDSPAVKSTGLSTTAPEAEPLTRECVSCLDDFAPTNIVELNCHSYCRECFRRLISTALESETQWPPKCCLKTIPSEKILTYIDASMKVKYKQREAKRRIFNHHAAWSTSFEKARTHVPDQYQRVGERLTGPSPAPPHPLHTPPISAKSSESFSKPATSDERHPFTTPITQEQLVAEVKGIYAGLVMVEAKCIEVDNKQATLAQADPGTQPKLNNEQWQALIALHRTLLHEHHDFFLASQNPSASPALRRLASKYAMPARMWRHGIHSFLELLRHRLPASLDHMLAFIYLAYSMMALLYETVPAFEDTWIECLGDLGRYRMAIEDDDIQDREVWTGVARHWYSKASDKAPTTGRLYHHLAILARPNALQQLFYYAKSLSVVIPFTSARDSILMLFDPLLNSDSHQGQYRLPPLDTSFVKAHGLLFTNKNVNMFEAMMQEFLGLLDNQIGRVTRKFMEQGYHVAVANTVAMLGFASKGNLLMLALSEVDLDLMLLSDSGPSSIPQEFSSSSQWISDPLQFMNIHGYDYRDPQSVPAARPSVPLTDEYLASSEIDWPDVARICSDILKRFSKGPNRFFNHSTRSLRRWLERRLGKFLRRQSGTLGTAFALAFAYLPTAEARPFNPSTTDDSTAAKDESRFLEFWKALWNKFKDQHSGPLAMNTAWAIFLTLLYLLITFCDKRTWKETGLFAIANWCISGSSFFLGMGDWLSDWQLALLWLFNFKLNLDFLNQKLSDLQRTQDLTRFCIITMGFLSAGMLSQCMAPTEGRYINGWILTAMLAPFMTLFYTHSWSVFLGDTDIARRIDNGTYNGLGAHLSQQLVLVSQRVFLAIMALVVLRSVMS